jgi:hypothetical protein
MKITIVSKSTVAPSTLPVYMQIWNVRTSLWETLATENLTSANDKFYLIGRIVSNESDYYDTAVPDIHFPGTYDLNEITVRLYQTITI